jgi:hypothetical protein
MAVTPRTVARPRREHPPTSRASQRSPEDRLRAAAQADKILGMLSAAGDRGCLKSELWAACHGVNSRVSDLRKRGHKIQALAVGRGVWQYRLIAQPGNSRFEQRQYEEFEREAPLFAGGGQ